MFDLVQEVVRHVPRELQLAVAQETKLDEVAVPAVHFVEPASGHDVRVWHVQEPVVANLIGARGQGA